MNERPSDLGGAPTEAVPASLGSGISNADSNAETLVGAGQGSASSSADPLNAAVPDGGDLDARHARAKVAGALFGDSSGDAGQSSHDSVRMGRYQIVDKLGAGGMGVVYKALDSELQREVALKVLMPDTARDELSQRRMLREARSLARLSHPNVVQVYDAGTEGDQVFLAMEYVAGRDLKAWLEQDSREPTQILERFLEAAMGLHAAHEQGLVHRDFKPANVLVGDDGRVRVVDFGLARAVDPEALPMLDANTQTGALVGTPMYMAPEQFEGKGADARSDQFAFCVALFSALFGARPFVGDNVAAYVSNVVQGRLVRPESLPPGIEKAVLPVLERGLKVQPGQRFRSMAELAAALRHAQAPAAAAAPGVGSARGFALVAGLVVVGALAWFAVGRTGNAAEEAKADAAPAQLVSAASTSEVAPEPEPAETGEGAAPVPESEPEPEPEAEAEPEPEPEADKPEPAPAPVVKARVRDYCAFHEDSYRLLRRGKSRPSTFEHAGACYRCKTEKRRSRIARLVPNDCTTYMMCSKAESEACQ